MRRSKADAEQTRSKILDAAAHLFCTRGIGQTTLEQIAREAGATRGAFYWHFKDKTDVLNAIYERYKPPQLARLEAAMVEERHDDPLEILNKTGLEFLTMVENDTIQQRLHLILLNAGPCDETALWRERLNVEIHQLLVRLLTRAQQEGRLTDELTPDEAAVSQMALINGLIGEWQRSGRAFPLRTVGAKLLPHFIEALRRRPPCADPGPAPAPDPAPDPVAR